MARKRPIRVCKIRQIPSSDPKSHHAEILEGGGRSIKELLVILSRGWDFWIFVIKFS